MGSQKNNFIRILTADIDKCVSEIIREMNPSDGGGDKGLIASKKNSGGGQELASSPSMAHFLLPKDVECCGLMKSGNGLAEDKLNVERQEIRMDVSGEAVDQREDHSLENGNTGDSDETKMKTKFPKKETKPPPPILYLPNEMWEKILTDVEYEDLKSMRRVCAYMNTEIIPNWTRLIQNGCLIMNGNSKFNSCSLADLDGVKYDKIRRRRMRRISSYFRVRSIRNLSIPRKFMSGNALLWLGTSVKTLELTDCILNWMNILDILNFFHCLEEFIISYKPRAKSMGDFIGILESGLGDGLVLKNTEQWEEMYEDSNSPTPTPVPMPISTLKTVKIKIPFMRCTNAVLRVLELKCSYLETLSITIDHELMQKTGLDISPRTCRIEAGDLLLKNVTTLKKVTLNLTSESVLKYDEYFWKSCRAMGVLFSFFGVHGLALEEFALNLPMYFLGTNPADERANETRELCLSPLRLFLTDQMNSLKLLRLSGFGWYPGADGMFQNEIIGDAVDVYTKVLVLGGNIANKPNWTLLKDKMDSLEIEWKGGDMKSVLAIFKGDTNAEAFEKVRHFSFYNNLIGFANLDLPFILVKFPNLTSLKIINYSKTDCFGQWDANDPGTTEEMAPQMFNIEIHDSLFQLILEKLPNLRTLHLDCHMQGVTDFGLTGMSDKALARMKNNKYYRIESGDKTGYSLTRLKRLTSLILIGLDKNVTNASVWLALRKLPLLKELVIIGKQKITEAAKTYLKNLEKRKDFYLEIEKPKGPNSRTTKRVD